MKKPAVVFAAAGLIAGAGALAAAQQQKVGEVTGGDELAKKKGYYRETWVRPDADITRYSKLHFWQAVFQFRDVGDERGGGPSIAVLQSEGPYAISQEARDRFKQIVADAFTQELQKSRQFQVVDTVDSDTLLVRTGILDITSEVPAAARHVDAYLSAVGEGTLLVQLIDPTTGVIQATVAERRKIQSPVAGQGGAAQRATANSVWSDVELWARSLANEFRRELDKAKAKAEKK